MADKIIINSFEELYKKLGDLAVKWAFNSPMGISGNLLKDLSGNGFDGVMNNVSLANPNDIPNRTGVFNGVNSYVATKFILPERYYIKMKIAPTSDATGVILSSADYAEGSTSQTNGTNISSSGYSKTFSINHHCYNGKSYMNNLSTANYPINQFIIYEVFHNNIMKAPLSHKVNNSDIRTMECNDETRQIRNVTIGKSRDYTSRLLYNGHIEFIEVYNLDKLRLTTFLLQDKTGKYYTIDAQKRIVTIPESQYINDDILAETIKTSGFDTGVLQELPKIIVDGWFQKEFKLVGLHPPQ